MIFRFPWFWCSSARCQKHFTVDAKCVARKCCSGPQAHEFPDGDIITVCGKCLRCRGKCCASARTTSSPTETSPLLSPSASITRKCCSSPKACEFPDGNFFTVDAKSFRARKGCSSPKAYELLDGYTVPVGTKRFRCADTEIGFAGAEVLSTCGHAEKLPVDVVSTNFRAGQGVERRVLQNMRFDSACTLDCYFSVLENPCLSVSCGTQDFCTVAVTRSMTTSRTQLL